MPPRPAAALLFAAVATVVTGSAAADKPEPAPAPPEVASAVHRSREQKPTPPMTLGILPVTTAALRLRPVDSVREAPSRPVSAELVSRSAPAPAATAVRGIPEIVLAAYRNAELRLAAEQPQCGVTWHLLAGIGRIESGHASQGGVDADGTSLAPIFGPLLDGSLPGNEIIRDDAGFVRAVGPMQFLPSTWSHYASDGNGDGASDPQNIFDATVGAARYLCAGGADLRIPDQRRRAILRYNNSAAYASEVQRWSAAYSGAEPPPDGTPDPAPAVPSLVPAPTDDQEPPSPPPPAGPSSPAPQPPPAMVHIPGLPPIPCGILCFPPPLPALPTPVPKP